MPDTKQQHAARAQRVLMVGGAMRSGTTVIHRALCTARNANPYISESWFIRDLLQMYGFRLDRFELMGADQFGSSQKYVDLVATNIEQYLTIVSARYDDPEVLILKQPELIRHFFELADLCPRMQFLAIIRDPRDVLASMKSVRAKHAEARVAGPFSGMNSIAAMCAFYASHYNRLLTSGNTLGARLLFIRYEDVMRTPTEAMARLGEFCGADFDLETIAEFTGEHARSHTFNKDLRAKDAFSRGFWSDMYTKSLSSERIGRFADSLTADEIEEIQTRLQAIGKRFRYWG